MGEMKYSFTILDLDTGTYWIGDWVGSIAGMDAMKKRNISPVSQHVTVPTELWQLLLLPSRIQKLYFYTKMEYPMR
jgi:hypothetical protein